MARCTQTSQVLRAWVSTIAEPLESPRAGAQAAHPQLMAEAWSFPLVLIRSPWKPFLWHRPPCEALLLLLCIEQGKCGFVKFVLLCSRPCSSCALQLLTTDTSQRLLLKLLPKMKSTHHCRIHVLFLVPLLFLYIYFFKSIFESFPIEWWVLWWWNLKVSPLKDIGPWPVQHLKPDLVFSNQSFH